MFAVLVLTLVSLQDGTVRFWDIGNVEEIPEVLQRKRTEGTGVHIRKVGPPAPCDLTLV